MHEWQIYSSYLVIIDKCLLSLYFLCEAKLVFYDSENSFSFVPARHTYYLHAFTIRGEVRHDGININTTPTDRIQHYIKI